MSCFGCGFDRVGLTDVQVGCPAYANMSHIVSSQYSGCTCRVHLRFSNHSFLDFRTYDCQLKLTDDVPRPTRLSLFSETEDFTRPMNRLRHLLISKKWFALTMSCVSSNYGLFLNMCSLIGLSFSTSSKMWF